MSSGLICWPAEAVSVIDDLSRKCAFQRRLIIQMQDSHAAERNRFVDRFREYREKTELRLKELQITFAETLLTLVENREESINDLREQSSETQAATACNEHAENSLSPSAPKGTYPPELETLQVERDTLRAQNDSLRKQVAMLTQLKIEDKPLSALDQAYIETIVRDKYAEELRSMKEQYDYSIKAERQRYEAASLYIAQVDVLLSVKSKESTLLGEMLRKIDCQHFGVRDYPENDNVNLRNILSEALESDKFFAKERVSVCGAARRHTGASMSIGQGKISSRPRSAFTFGHRGDKLCSSETDAESSDQSRHRPNSSGLPPKSTPYLEVLRRNQYTQNIGSFSHSNIDSSTVHRGIHTRTPTTSARARSLKKQLEAFESKRDFHKLGSSAEDIGFASVSVGDECNHNAVSVSYALDPASADATEDMPTDPACKASASFLTTRTADPLSVNPNPNSATSRDAYRVMNSRRLERKQRASSASCVKSGPEAQVRKAENDFSDDETGSEQRIVNFAEPLLSPDSAVYDRMVQELRTEHRLGTSSAQDTHPAKMQDYTTRISSVLASSGLLLTVDKSGAKSLHTSLMPFLLACESTYRQLEQRYTLLDRRAQLQDAELTDTRSLQFAAATERDRLQAESSMLRKVLTETQSEYGGLIQSYEGTISTQEGKLACLSGDLSEASKQILDLRNKVQQHVETNNILRSDIERMRASLLEELSGKLRYEENSRIGCLQAEVAFLKSTQRSYEEQFEGLASDIARLEHHNSEMKLQLLRHNLEKDKLRKQIQDALNVKYHQYLSALEQKIIDLEADVVRAEDGALDKCQHIYRLRSDVDTLTRDNSQMLISQGQLHYEVRDLTRRFMSEESNRKIIQKKYRKMFDEFAQQADVIKNLNTKIATYRASVAHMETRKNVVINSLRIEVFRLLKVLHPGMADENIAAELECIIKEADDIIISNMDLLNRVDVLRSADVNLDLVPEAAPADPGADTEDNRISQAKGSTIGITYPMLHALVTPQDSAYDGSGDTTGLNERPAATRLHHHTRSRVLSFSSDGAHEPPQVVYVKSVSGYDPAKVLSTIVGENEARSRATHLLSMVSKDVQTMVQSSIKCIDEALECDIKPLSYGSGVQVTPTMDFSNEDAVMLAKAYEEIERARSEKRALLDKAHEDTGVLRQRIRTLEKQLTDSQASEYKAQQLAAEKEAESERTKKACQELKQQWAEHTCPTFETFKPQLDAVIADILNKCSEERDAYTEASDKQWFAFKEFSHTHVSGTLFKLQSDMAAFERKVRECLNHMTGTLPKLEDYVNRHAANLAACPGDGYRDENIGTFDDYSSTHIIRGVQASAFLGMMTQANAQEKINNITDIDAIPSLKFDHLAAHSVERSFNVRPGRSSHRSSESFKRKTGFSTRISHRCKDGVQWKQHKNDRRRGSLSRSVASMPSAQVEPSSQFLKAINVTSIYAKLDSHLDLNDEEKRLIDTHEASLMQRTTTKSTNTYKSFDANFVSVQRAASAQNISKLQPLDELIRTMPRAMSSHPPSVNKDSGCSSCDRLDPRKYQLANGSRLGQKELNRNSSTIGEEFLPSGDIPNAFPSGSDGYQSFDLSRKNLQQPHVFNASPTGTAITTVKGPDGASTKLPFVKSASYEAVQKNGPENNTAIQGICSAAIDLRSPSLPVVGNKLHNSSNSFGDDYERVSIVNIPNADRGLSALITQGSPQIKKLVTKTGVTYLITYDGAMDNLGDMDKRTARSFLNLHSSSSSMITATISRSTSEVSRKSFCGSEDSSSDSSSVLLLHDPYSIVAAMPMSPTEAALTKVASSVEPVVAGCKNRDLQPHLCDAQNPNESFDMSSSTEPLRLDEHIEVPEIFCKGTMTDNIENRMVQLGHRGLLVDFDSEYYDGVKNIKNTLGAKHAHHPSESLTSENNTMEIYPQFKMSDIFPFISSEQQSTPYDADRSGTPDMIAMSLSNLVTAAKQSAKFGRTPSTLAINNKTEDSVDHIGIPKDLSYGRSIRELQSESHRRRSISRPSAVSDNSPRDRLEGPSSYETATATTEDEYVGRIISDYPELGRSKGIQEIALAEQQYFNKHGVPRPHFRKLNSSMAPPSNTSLQLKGQLDPDTLLPLTNRELYRVITTMSIEQLQSLVVVLCRRLCSIADVSPLKLCATVAQTYTYSPALGRMVFSHDPFIEHLYMVIEDYAGQIMRMLRATEAANRRAEIRITGIQEANSKAISELEARHEIKVAHMLNKLVSKDPRVQDAAFIDVLRTQVSEQSNIIEKLRKSLNAAYKRANDCESILSLMFGQRFMARCEASNIPLKNILRIGLERAISVLQQNNAQIVYGGVGAPTTVGGYPTANELQSTFPGANNSSSNPAEALQNVSDFLVNNIVSECLGTSLPPDNNANTVSLLSEQSSRKQFSGRLRQAARSISQGGQRALRRREPICAADLQRFKDVYEQMLCPHKAENFAQRARSTSSALDADQSGSLSVKPASIIPLPRPVSRTHVSRYVTDCELGNVPSNSLLLPTADPVASPLQQNSASFDVQSASSGEHNDHNICESQSCHSTPNRRMHIIRKLPRITDKKRDRLDNTTISKVSLAVSRRPVSVSFASRSTYRLVEPSDSKSSKRVMAEADMFTMKPSIPPSPHADCGHCSRSYYRILAARALEKQKVAEKTLQNLK